jgi:adenylylsulfate kinase
MRRDPSTPKRSFLKALSWETFSNLLTFGLALAIFGDVTVCTVFFIIGFILKLALFYVHERIWHQVQWGKIE